MITLQWGDDGEYLMGGSHVGIPLFSYARSKYVTWGATAVNPDISDLFVEKIKDG
jgi:acyl-homoserine lactone acylase PvdQ